MPKKAQLFPKLKLRKNFLPISQTLSNYFIESFGEDYDVWKKIILGSKEVCDFLNLNLRWFLLTPTDMYMGRTSYWLI